MVIGTGVSNRGGWGGMFASMEASDKKASDSSTVGEVVAINYDTSLINVKVDGEANLVLERIPWTTLRAGGTKTYFPPTIGEKVLIVCPGGNLSNAIAATGMNDSEDPYTLTGANIQYIEFPNGDIVKYDSSTHRLTVVVSDKVEVQAGSTKLKVKTNGVDIEGNTAITGNFQVLGNVSITGNVTLNGVMNSSGNVNAPNIP